ncbi:retrovirus-related Pol polyprotein from transposon 412 [Trichonephila clavipes]|nr:retrovirus-related Pol polyprotein from transposon 412 [Trichonephila clavipes]
MRKELLAIVKAVECFHSYLYGCRFLLQTDHASLTWLLNFENPEGQIASWIQRLQEYDVEIHHRKGSVHGNTDTLSRRPCLESCKYCSRIEKKFDIIDAIVPHQVTAPSTSESDPWCGKSIRRDQLAVWGGFFIHLTIEKLFMKNIQFLFFSDDNSNPE